MVPLDVLEELAAEMPPDYSEVLAAVLALPSKYREVIYLHYCEGYSAPEIGKLLRKNVNSVYTLLNRGREMLKKKLEGIGYGK
jgi:RNA polymerase sigma-70 factor (ECF subfamily)